MPRQRKGQQTASNSVPLVRLTDASDKKIPKPLIEISDEEQWRLINESGVLKKISRSEQITPSSLANEEEENSTFGEQLLNTILYVVPFSFLLMMMEMCVPNHDSMTS